MPWSIALCSLKDLKQRGQVLGAFLAAVAFLEEPKVWSITRFLHHVTSDRKKAITKQTNKNITQVVHGRSNEFPSKFNRPVAAKMI